MKKYRRIFIPNLSDDGVMRRTPPWTLARNRDDDIEYIRKDIFHDVEGEVVALRQDNALLMTENARYRAELAKQKKYTKSAVEYAERRDDHDTEMNEIVDELRAELARVKPDWATAPGWGYSLVGHWHWHSLANESHQPVNAGYVVDYRPEET